LIIQSLVVASKKKKKQSEQPQATASNRKQAMQLAEQDLVSIVSSADTIELVLIQVTVFLA